jgi:hypothetical protein
MRGTVRHFSLITTLQVKMCMTNRAYFKEVGDISSSNKFEQMAVHSKKDLDAVRC